MTYLLDTNACIALINGEPAGVRRRLEEILGLGEAVSVSSVVLFELWYGIHKSARAAANKQRLERFLSGPISILSFEDADAQAAGSIRAELEKVGKPIGAYDLLIAGQAVRHGCVVVTANNSEFRRVKSLRWEDWSKL